VFPARPGVKVEAKSARGERREKMKNIRSARLFAVVPGIALMASGLALQAVTAGSKVPPAVAPLLPKAAVLKSGSWDAFPNEFGKTFTGETRAEFPGRSLFCNVTIGPELRVSLKGDTAWEEPPILDMAVQVQTDEID